MRRRWIAAILLLCLGAAAGAAFLARASRAVEPSLAPTSLFQQVFSHVKRYGVDSLPEQELYRRAADGLLTELDDEYAMILPAGAELQDVSDPGGLGLQLATRDGRVVVLGVLPESPAQRAGILPGDQLLEIASRPVEANRRDLLLGSLDGPPGSRVKVRLRRPGIGVPLTWDLVRGRPPSSVVSASVRVAPGVGYLGLRLIGPGTAQALEGKLRGLTAEGVGSLVLDLRGASLGTLDEAVAVADLFLDPQAVIVEVRRRGTASRRYEDGEVQAWPGLRIVILVDSATADAGEAIAGALQDHDRALVLGEPTFGRGLSQENFPLDQRMTIRMSTGRWVTPGGRVIQRDSTTTDTLAKRPRARTDGGRTVLGGGGIIPDSVVRPDSMPLPQRELLRALGGSLPAFYEAVHQVAQELAKAGGASQDFRPTDADRDRLYAVLGEQRVVVTRDVFLAARDWLDQLLGDEVVRLAVGPDAVLQRQLARDPLVRLAVTRLAQAKSPADLVGLKPALPAAR